MQSERNIETPGEETTQNYLARLFTKLRKWTRDHPLESILLTFVTLGLGFLCFWAIFADISPSWTGFGTYRGGPRAKTLWDWLDLLIVPAVLGFVAYWLNNSQKQTELKIAEDQRKEDRKNAEEQRKVDLKIAEERQQQATLESYFDNMTELLLDHDLRGKANHEERIIARARTLAVLRSLQGAPSHKGQVVKFLHEVGLIKVPLKDTDAFETLLLLEGADLSYADLRGADLIRVDLSGANLYGARLERANLQKSKLNGANLENAQLGGADLSEANLSGSKLINANLESARLRVTGLFRANMSGAKLGGAYLGGADLSHAEMIGVDLTRAYLQAKLDQADLTGAILRESDLAGSSLIMAILRGADLSDAILRDAALGGTQYDKDTKWPDWFDPENADCILVKSQ